MLDHGLSQTGVRNRHQLGLEPTTDTVVNHCQVNKLLRWPVLNKHRVESCRNIFGAFPGVSYQQALTKT